MTMKIPFTDLAATYQRQKPEIDATIARVTQSGWYVGGPEVAGFERAFARATGLPFAVGVANGTDAIALALRALGVGRDDEVVIPALSAYPTTVGVLQAEATPSFVDVDSHGLMDPVAVAAALTPRVRAVVCVHLYGNCADAPALLRLCRDRGIVLVEDCAQAHGATRAGVAAGATGDAAAWSFYPTKNLGAHGDAGAVTCASEELAAKLSRLRNYGQRNRYEHVERGFNSRLDPLQAAILSVKLTNLQHDNARRRAIGLAYDGAFAGHPHLSPLPVPPQALPNRHLYPVLLGSAERRDAFQAFLAERGIETLIHYPIAMPDQQASAPAWSQGRDFPNARRLCACMVSLPSHPDLSDAQVAYVIEAVQDWSRRC